MRVFIAATIAALIVTPAAAQQRPPTGIEVTLAPGLVWHGAIFGDDDPKSAGAARLTVAGLVRAHIHRLAGFTFEGAIEPMGITNPHFDEHLHSLHALAGVEIGRRLTVRPAIGVAVQVWTGRNAESGVGIAPAVGLAIGHRHRPQPGPGSGRWQFAHISPEVIARASMTHGTFSWMAGVQVPFTWRR